MEWPPTGRRGCDCGSLAPAEVDFYSIVKELGRGERPIGDEPRAQDGFV